MTAIVHRRGDAGGRRKARNGTATYRYEQGTRVTAWCYLCGSAHSWADPCEAQRKLRWARATLRR